MLLPGSKQRLSQGSAINPRPGKYPQVRMSTASIVDVIKYSDQKQLEEERVCFTLWFPKESIHGLKGKVWWQEQETGQSHDHISSAHRNQGRKGGREGESTSVHHQGWMLATGGPVCPP